MADLLKRLRGRPVHPHPSDQEAAAVSRLYGQAPPSNREAETASVLYGQVASDDAPPNGVLDDTMVITPVIVDDVPEATAAEGPGTPAEPEAATAPSDVAPSSPQAADWSPDGNGRPSARERGRMRRRLRDRRRTRDLLLLELGAIVLEIQRRGDSAQSGARPLLEAKVAEVKAVDDEARALAEALDEGRSIAPVAAPEGARACQACGALAPSDAGSCPSCGRPLGDEQAPEPESAHAWNAEGPGPVAGPDLVVEEPHPALAAGADFPLDELPSETSRVTDAETVDEAAAVDDRENGGPAGEPTDRRAEHPSPEPREPPDEPLAGTAPSGAPSSEGEHASEPVSAEAVEPAPGRASPEPPPAGAEREPWEPRSGAVPALLRRPRIRRLWAAAQGARPDRNGRDGS